MSVLIVGSVALDSVESPAGSVKEALGGAATYASIAARTLHDDVAIVGVVGDDFPEEHVRLLEQRGVNLTGLERAPGRTFRWAGRYHEDTSQRDTLDTQLNVFAHFSPRIPPELRAAELLFLANIDPELQLSVLDQVDDPQMVFCDTMNFWIQGKRNKVLAVLARSDVAFLNDEEARMLTGQPSLLRAASAVQALGPSHVIIKKGPHGAELHSPEGVFYCPAFPVPNAADPTGAGDAFAGGVIGHLAEAGEDSDEEMRRAVVVGTVVASYCVEGFSMSGLLRAGPVTVRERYEELQRMSAIPEP